MNVGPRTPASVRCGYTETADRLPTCRPLGVEVHDRDAGWGQALSAPSSPQDREVHAIEPPDLAPQRG